MNPLPVARPLMPRAEAILPYLTRIDASRTYSNFGPLASELEARLADRLNIEAAGVVSVANGTTGLVLALSAMAEGRTGVCLMPSWTFVATAHAVAAAGFTPCLTDVDLSTWSLTPAMALDALARLDRPVAAVMAVAPFGAPVDIGAWDRFTALTGVPVVIDAAAGHDALQAGSTPAVVSLHATKILGGGEGGYVACTRPDLIRAIRQRSNFGFNGSRNAEIRAINGKMSEYHAAVALASMDAYPVEIGRFSAVARAYRRHLAPRPDIQFQPGFGEGWCGSVLVARFAGSEQDGIAARLKAAGIDSRQWWGDGVHRQSAFRDEARLPLPNTELLARETLGLPFFSDMRAADVERVCALLAELRQAPPLPRAA